MTIRPKKDWWTLLFLIVFISLTINRNSIKIYRWLHFRFFDTFDYIFAFLLIVIILYFTGQLLWLLTGQVIINISNDYLSVDKKIIGISRTNKYELTKISNISILENENSNTFWGFKGIRIHDTNAKILNFSFNSKTFNIGNKLEDFDAEKIKHEICSRQK